MKASFGRYVLLKKIAVGGMAEIFLARRLSYAGFAKFVVIKRLLPEHRGRKSYEQLFLAEARITAALNHPNIINVHDLGALDDAYFIAMEYVHGMSTAEMMAMAAKKGLRVPLGVALHVTRCVAEALHFGDVSPDLDGEPFRVIHHDVSPHNIQLGLDGRVKLLDYGVATRMNTDAPGGRRGKYAYMAPEAIARGEMDPRADLFSLGVCLFELTVGRRLFKGKSPQETKAKAISGKVPRPTQIRPDYPPALEAVLFKTLARDPEARFQSGRALADALDDVARELGLDAGPKAMGDFLHELLGDGVERRRIELQELARASTPRKPGEAPPESGTEAVHIQRQEQTGSLVEALPPEASLALPSAPPADEATPSPLDSTGHASAADLALAKAQAAEAAAFAEPSDGPSMAELPPGANDSDEADWDAMMSAPLSNWRRLTLLVGLLGLVSAAAAFFVGQHLGAAGPSKGTVTIESNPSGARVYNGGKLLGMTPFETAPSAFGTVMKLRLSKQGYDDWSTTISITPRRPYRTVTVTLQKQR